MSDRVMEDLSRADPFIEEQVDEEVVAAQLRSILDSDRPTAPRGQVKARRAGRHRGLGRIQVAAAVGGIAIAAAVWFGVVETGSSPNEGTAFAAPLLRIAENNPRLLVVDPDWHVTDANEFGRRYGELTFSDGERELEIRWAPASDYAPTYRDRLADAKPDEVDLSAGSAAIFRQGGSDFSALIAPMGGTYVEMRGSRFGGLNEFVSVVDTVRQTDVNTWLSALPASVVTVEDRSVEVDRMLGDTPLPEGFDLARLKDDAGLVIGSSQLRYLLASTVACAWIDQWKARSSNGESTAEARATLDSAASWPVVAGMRQSGIDHIVDWTEDGLGGSGFGPDTDPNYRLGLGCDG